MIDPVSSRPPCRSAKQALLLIVLPFLLAGCLPIPNLQVDLNVAPPDYRMPPEEVPVEYFVREGFAEPSTPSEFNRTGYLRYSSDEDPAVILLLMPGIFGGAASFDVIARQLVAAIPGLEVWAVDRRANMLEDRSAMIASLASGDPRRAYEYYVVDRGSDEGFSPLGYDEVPFLRRWGLEVHLQDLHRLVLEARNRAPVVMLGGHSLGASLMSLYVAYYVPSVGDRTTGQDFIDGLILLDGSLGRTGGFGRDDVGIGLGPLRVAPSVGELQSGRGASYADTIVSPRYQIEREVIALLARLAPEEDAPAGLTDLRVSNRALVGVRNDDEYVAVPIFSSSLGHAVGAEFDGNITAVLLGGIEGVRSRSVVGVADGFDRIEWSAGDPERERTDLDSYISAWTMADTNFSEWYFPLRLALDMTLLDPRLEEAEGFIPNRLVTVPTLSLGAGRGLNTSLTGMRAYANIRYGSPITAYVLPGLTHLDVVTARVNPAVPILQRWIAFFADL